MPYPRRPLQPTRSAIDWLGAEVRYWRELRGLSPRELGGAVGLSADGIEKIEKGDRLCSAEHAVLMDKVLDTGGVLARFQPNAKAEAVARRSPTTPRSTHPPLSASARPREVDQDVAPRAHGSHAPRPTPDEGSWDDPAAVIDQLSALTGSTTGAAASLLNSSIRALVEAYEYRGPVALGPEARQLRTVAHRLLRDHALPHHARCDLLHAAGQTAGLLSYMAVFPVKCMCSGRSCPPGARGGWCGVGHVVR